jgi:uncharacterized SAM-binding protein YcdF (DUF218 family)
LIEKKFLIAVVGGGTSRVGRLSFFTKRRIKKAADLGRSLDRAGIHFRYAVVPSSATLGTVPALLKFLLENHPEYDSDILIPPAEVVIPKQKDRRAFVTKVATARNEDVIFF